MKNKAAFTLIELLVVITVLAGFMALLVPNYMEVRKKSRDVKRKNDLKGIQKAIELYKQSQTPQVYPPALSFSVPLTDPNDVHIIYMQKVPQDPQGTYYYYRNGDDTNKYTLCACLENVNDPDGNKVLGCVRSDDSAPPGALTCGTTGVIYKLNEP